MHCRGLSYVSRISTRPLAPSSRARSTVSSAPSTKQARKPKRDNDVKAPESSFRKPPKDKAFNPVHAHTKASRSLPSWYPLGQEVTEWQQLQLAARDLAESEEDVGPSSRAVPSGAFVEVRLCVCFCFWLWSVYVSDHVPAPKIPTMALLSDPRRTESGSP